MPGKECSDIWQNLAWKQYYIPRCLFHMVFCCVKGKIREQAQFNVDDLDIVREIKGKALES